MQRWNGSYGHRTCVGLATIREDGYPHCVPISYHYHEELLYIPAYSGSRKVENLKRDGKCCVIVDEYDGRKGRGVMLQGQATVPEQGEFPHLKGLLQRITGWDFGQWRVGQKKDHEVDTIIVFKPEKIAIIGRID